jgi:hypothetical protein
MPPNGGIFFVSPRLNVVTEKSSLLSRRAKQAHNITALSNALYSLPFESAEDYSS